MSKDGGVQLRNKDKLSESISQVLYSYTKGQTRYMNEFIRLYKSASDMLILGLFPNAKEITESYAAFNATQKMKLNQKDATITLVSVGDGTTPRTAGLFAFYTKWNCISVDPLLNQDKIPIWESQIQRLKCFPNKIEDLDLKFEKIVIVAVHSHAKLKDILYHVRGNVRSLIAIPCCVGYVHSIPSKEYIDSGIWSPKNKVMIWKSI